MAVFWKIITMVTAPSRPRPAVSRPATPPVRKATFRAAGKSERRAAAAVRTLPRTAMRHADEPDGAGEHGADDEGDGAEGAGLGEGQGDAEDLAVGFLVDRGRGEEHHDGHRHHDDGDGAELAAQVGEGAFLDGAGDLLHLLGALLLGEHAAHEHHTEQQRHDGDDGGEDQPPPLGAGEVEGLVATFGGEDLGHCPSWLVGPGLVAGSITSARGRNRTHGRRRFHS